MLSTIVIMCLTLDVTSQIISLGVKGELWKDPVNILDDYWGFYYHTIFDILERYRFKQNRTLYIVPGIKDHGTKQGPSSAFNPIDNFWRINPYSRPFVFLSYGWTHTTMVIAEILEIANILPYISSANSLLSASGNDKLPNTIRIGPSLKFISNACMEILRWVNNKANNIGKIYLMHEITYASSEIAQTIVDDIRSSTDLEWTTSTHPFERPDFSGVVKEEKFFFNEHVSGRAKLDTAINNVIMQSRGELKLFKDFRDMMLSVILRYV